MNDGSYQTRGFPWFEFIGTIVALAILFFAMAAGGAAGGGTVNVASNNRILSPDTTIIVNSNNTTSDTTSNAPTTVTGDRNVITTQDGTRLCFNEATGVFDSTCAGQP